MLIGNKGDINLDGCVNIVDIVVLVDFILNNNWQNEYEFWVGDMYPLFPDGSRGEGILDVNDTLELSDYILNLPSCSPLQRNLASTYLAISSQPQLERGAYYIDEVIIDSDIEIKGMHTEITYENATVVSVEMSESYDFMTVDWATRGDTLAFLFYSLEGQTIEPGNHSVALIEYESDLDRGDVSIGNHFWGEIVDPTFTGHRIGFGSTDYSDEIEVFALNPAFPNPSNSSFTIPIELQTSSKIALSIYDINGELIDILAKGSIPAGNYEYIWDCNNFASGIYFAVMIIEDKNYVEKLLLLK